MTLSNSSSTDLPENPQFMGLPGCHLTRPDTVSGQSLMMVFHAEIAHALFDTGTLRSAQADRGHKISHLRALRPNRLPGHSGGSSP
jgi:hypothetical protein